MNYMKLLVFLVVLAAVGCGSDESTTTADGATEATLSSIQENIFSKRCTAGPCHNADAEAGGLVLSDGDSYAELVGVKAEYPGQTEETRVVAGDADGSFLIVKLEGTVSGEGDRMPQRAAPLSDEDVAIIRQWITDGAENN